MSHDINRVFCPNCGQPALPDVRFCSKCGFQLRAVTDLLASGGVPMWQVQQEQEAPKQTSPRKRGLRQGAALMLTGIVLLPVLAAMFEEVGAMAMVTLFLAGLARSIYSLALLEKEPKPAPPPAPQQPFVPPQMEGGYTPPALPPQPVSFMDPPKRVDTNDLVAPPSVTEHTTRFLEKESE